MENTFNIEYDLNGGTSVSNPERFSYKNRNDEALKLPTKEGYTCLGWYDENNRKITKTSDLTANNVTLTARWEKEYNKIKTLTVKKENGGILGNKECTNQDVVITLEMNGPFEEGMHWWYKNTKDYGSDWKEFSSKSRSSDSISLSFSEEGYYSLMIKNTFDNDDPEYIHEGTIDFTIDKTPPVITLLQGEKAVYLGMSYAFSDISETHSSSYLSTLTVNGEVTKSLGGNGPYFEKISGFLNKDTEYTIVVTDRAGNEAKKTFVMKAVPDVDDVTLDENIMLTIGEIKAELEQKIDSGYFEQDSQEVKDIQSRVAKLEARYNDLVEKAPIDKIIELSSAVTKDNVTTGNVELLKGLKQQLIEKYEAVKDKDNCPLTQEAYEKEIKRIDGVIAHHEKVMKEYNTAIKNAEAYIKTGCHLGNLKEGQTMITSLEKMLKTNSHNYTTEEVARINQNIVTIRDMTTLLQNAKDELQECVDSFDKLDANKYTSESYAQLKEAYDDAVKALNDKNSTTEVLNEKLEAFKKQMNALKANDVVVSDNNSKDKSEDKKKKSIETGDNSDLVGLTYGLLVSTGTIVYLSKKKKELNKR